MKRQLGVSHLNVRLEVDHFSISLLCQLVVHLTCYFSVLDSVMDNLLHSLPDTTMDLSECAMLMFLSFVLSSHI